MIEKVVKFKYGILTILTGIFFVVYMLSKIGSSANPADAVGGFEPLRVLFHLILHIPFLIAILLAFILYLSGKNPASSYVLGIPSFLYLLLHEFVFSYSYYQYSYFYFMPGIRFISLFPLLGMIISGAALVEYRRQLQGVQ